MVEETPQEAPRDARIVSAADRADAQPGGTLHFWTDVEEYFRTTLELIAAYTRLLGPFEVPETPAENDLAYRTHFERRMRLNNEPVYRAQYTKRPNLPEAPARPAG